MKKEFKIGKFITFTDRKSRYIAAAIIAFVLLVGLIIAMPLYKDTRVASCMGSRTERSGLIYYQPLVQRFVPSGSKIEYIEIHYTDCSTNYGTIDFTLTDAKGNELYTETINIADLEQDCYYTYNVNLNVHKGRTYYFKILSNDVPAYKSPKVWVSNNAPDDVREVVFYDQNPEVRLQTNTEIGYAQFHYFAYVLSILAALGACFTITLKFTISEDRRRDICKWIILVMPVVMFMLVESLNANSIGMKSLQVWLINYFLYLIIYILFFVLTNRLRFAVLFSNVLIFIIAIVNFYKLQFRGEPFTLSDFASMKTAANVASEYEIRLNYMVLTAATVFMLVTAIVSRFRYSMKTIKIRLVMSVLVLSMSLLLVKSLFNADRYSASANSFMQRIGVVNNIWNQPKNFTDNGVLVAITMNAKFLVVNTPDTYSLNYMSHVKNDLDNNYGRSIVTGKEMSQYAINKIPDLTRMPNIICIMNESYSDFSQFGDIENELSQPYQPFIDSLKDSPNAVTGELYVSTYGGGTANSEFEFLSGNTMLALPQGCIPYQQYIDSPTGSIARTLKNIGYDTVALHPYNATGWNRPEVYKQMSFDAFYAADDFTDAEYIRSYISDKCSYDKLIDLYEEQNRTSDAPFFMFNVTMQNHGGYTKSYANFTPDVSYVPAPGEYPQAEQYFSVARNTDEATRQLIEYFSNVDEPTVICFFGDHLPNLGDGFYEHVMGVNSVGSLKPDEMQNLYMTDYFIWANYDISGVKNRDLSLNYLSTLLFEIAGVPFTEYQQFLSETYKDYPVITSLGVRDNKGNYLGGSEVFEGVSMWDYYQCLVYNNIFETDNRLTTVFDFPEGVGKRLDYEISQGRTPDALVTPTNGTTTTREEERIG